MNNNDNFRYTIVLMIILCYFLPIITLTSFSMGMMPQNSSWTVFTLGLLISVSGSSVLFLLINQWAGIWQKQMNEIKKSVINNANTPAIALPSSIATNETSDFSQEFENNQMTLTAKIEANGLEMEELRKENSSLHKQKKQFSQEQEHLKTSFQEQLAQKDAAINECKQTIALQSTISEKFQKQLSLLEAKERDLTYEIKTLLQMSEIAKQPVKAPFERSASLSSNQQFKFSNILKEPTSAAAPSNLTIRSPHMAAVELHHCLELAKKADSTSAAAGPTDIALEQKNLFNRLRRENSCGILLFSPVEDKILFVNDEVCEQSGWSLEQFQTSFQEIVQETGLQTWKKSLHELSLQNEVQIQLPIKAQTGIEKLFYCRLGTVPSGTFRNHVIGVLYPY